MMGVYSLGKSLLILTLFTHANFDEEIQIGLAPFSSRAEERRIENASESCPDEAFAQKQLLTSFMVSYDKQALPSAGKNPVNTLVEMHINDIPSLSELNSEFVLDIMYSEMWTDKRLEFANLPQGQCISNITLDLDYLTKLWTPNTCIVNSKAATIHKSPSENVFLILYQDGTVWKNCRMMVRAPCVIDLRAFPFDQQKCRMVFESYSYNSRKVQLQWFEHAAITLLKKMELPDFNLVKWDVKKNVMEYPNGNWDQLEAMFYFKRRYGFFILQAYVPTYLTIFVAWINFWMDPKELSTRATLSISAFLCITLQFGNIIKNQPPVSYVKALDVWMLGCIIFLFSALAELAVVSFMQRSDRPRKIKKRKPCKQKESIELQVPINQEMPNSNNNNLEKNSDSENNKDQFEQQHNNGHVGEIIIREIRKKKISTATFREFAKRYPSITPFQIDKFCLICFPSTFLAFNLFYWCYFVGFDNLW